MWPPANALISTRPCLNNRFQLAAEVVYRIILDSLTKLIVMCCFLGWYGLFQILLSRWSSTISCSSLLPSQRWVTKNIGRYCVNWHPPELILHPFTPLYFGGKSYNYKSYLVSTYTFYPRVLYCTEIYFHGRLQWDFLVNSTHAMTRKLLNWKKGILRLDACSTHPLVFLSVSLINDLASTLLLPGEEYDRKNFVIKRELTNLKVLLARLGSLWFLVSKFSQDHERIVDENILKDPHIKFYVDTNPGWNEVCS